MLSNARAVLNRAGNPVRATCTRMPLGLDRLTALRLPRHVEIADRLERQRIALPTGRHISRRTLVAK